MERLQSVHVTAMSLTSGNATETPDLHGAYPRLSGEQVARLAPHGRQRPVRAGEVLYAEGERSDTFTVILRGLVAVVQGYRTPEEQVVRVHGPRRFLGELGLLTGQALSFTSVAVDAGEVLEVPVQALRDMVTEDPMLGDLILRAYLTRRTLSIGVGAGFRIVGSRFSRDTRRLREFASRNRLPHRFLDVEEDAHAEQLLRRLGVRPEETPVVIWRDRVLRNPSNAELAEMIGLRSVPDGTAPCDLVVVGAGPAGLAASVYGASEGLSTVALDSVATGGQAATSSLIENYLGFPSGISGGELADRAVVQAERFGARISVPGKATRLLCEDGGYRVQLDDGTSVATRTVVISTGAHYRRLPVPGLDQYEATSVYYAATLSEAQQCTAHPVTVVGGGNSAGQATVFLADHAHPLRLVLREHSLYENMSRYLADRILGDRRVEVLPHHEVREVVGDGHVLRAVVVEDTETGERRELQTRDLFVFIGATPCTEWLADAVTLDPSGYVRTGPDALHAAPERASAFSHLNREPLLLETTAPGVFAAGDVRSGSIKRVASAVGEGSMAVRLVHEHLATYR